MKCSCNRVASSLASACGLWSTLISTTTHLGPDQSLILDEDNTSSHLWEAFRAVGLDESIIQYTPSYSNQISACLMDVYHSAKVGSTFDDGTVPTTCTGNDLFPFGNGTGSVNSTLASLGGCLDQICATVTLDSDLAGPGVSFSMKRRMIEN